MQANPIPLATCTVTSMPQTQAQAGNNQGVTSWDLDVDTGRRELAQAEEWGDVNSEDDDELEDMFLGKWTPKLAARRRKVWEKEVSEGRRMDDGLGLVEASGRGD